MIIVTGDVPRCGLCFSNRRLPEGSVRLSCRLTEGTPSPLGRGRLVWAAAAVPRRRQGTVFVVFADEAADGWEAAVSGGLVSRVELD